jgi:hypothetical protein
MRVIQGCAWGISIISMVIFAPRACRVGLQARHRLRLLLRTVWSWLHGGSWYRAGAELDTPIGIYAAPTIETYI